MTASDRRIILGVVIAVVLCGNLLVPWLIESVGSDGEVFLFALIFGGIVAELALLGIWCALSIQEVHLRLSITCGIVMVGYGLFLLGIKLQDPHLDIDTAALLLIFTVANFVGIQLPLWFVRHALRLRIGLRWQTRVEPNTGRFSIRYLLVATTVIAVIVALVNAASLEWDLSGTLPMWLLGLLGLLIFSLIASLFCLPCVWLVLSQCRSTITSAAICLVLVWLGGPIVLAMFIKGSGGNGAGAMILFVLNFGGSVAGNTIAGLLLLRVLDYRLLVADRQGNLLMQSDRQDWRMHRMGPKVLPPIEYPDANADSE